MNCPLPKPPRDGRIVHDRPVTGSSTMYGQGWAYVCNPPKAPSYERGSCMASGNVTEPPECRGILSALLLVINDWPIQRNNKMDLLLSMRAKQYLLFAHILNLPRGELPHSSKYTKWFHHFCCDEATWLQGED